MTLARFFNLMDAELLKTRLESHGIPVFLADEASFTAGYGPAAGALRLQVREADAVRAREVLGEAPTIELPDDFEVEGDGPVAEPQRETPLVPLVIGLAVLGALIAFFQTRRPAPRPPAVETYEQDSNGDGRSDAFYRYENGVLVETTGDANFDGRIDCWCTMKNGIPVSAKQDTDFNGVPDSFSTYVHGITQQTDIRPNGSPIVTCRFICRDGVLREEFVDDDEDGKFDRKIEYDPFSKPTATIDLK